MAAKEGPNILFWMPNRAKCILLVSVMAGTAHVGLRDCIS
jgi:hypothetical protein